MSKSVGPESRNIKLFFKKKGKHIQSSKVHKASQVLNPTWIYLFKPKKDSLNEKEKKNLKTADKVIKTITKTAKVLCLKWKVFEILQKHVTFLL